MNKLAWVLAIGMTLAAAAGFVLYAIESKESNRLRSVIETVAEQHKNDLATAEKQRVDAIAAAEKQQAVLLENLKAENAKALELVRVQNKKDSDDLRAQQDASDRRIAAERELDRKKSNIDRLAVQLKEVLAEAVKCHEEFTRRPSGTTLSIYTKALDNLITSVDQIQALATEAHNYLSTNPDLEPSTREKALKNRDEAETQLAKIGPARAKLSKARNGIRQADFDVQANEAWQSFPLQVAAGEEVCVEANGVWRYGNFAGNAVGATGENGAERYRIVSNLGNGALVARVQGLADIFAGVPSFVPSRGGTLQFQINDYNVRDNSGSLRLKVWILPGPD